MLSLVHMISRSVSGRLWRSRLSLVVAVLVAGTLGLAASAAYASFPSSALLDNFTADTALSPSWTTPALGEGPMTVSAAGHDLEGLPGNWDAAIWNAASFRAPVEVWAAITRAGTNDACLYADVIGGGSAIVHPPSGYFVDFGGTSSHGSPRSVSLWRIDGPVDEVRLTFVGSPYTNLRPGDEIGLSIGTNGALIAWYKPVGGSWRAVVSWHDHKYKSGQIAIEAIPGAFYGFGNFGGGNPRTPVVSRITRTSIGSSARQIRAGQHVAYTAKISPVPRRGTVSFADDGVTIPGCDARPINRGGKATCVVTYSSRGSHRVGARYSGSPNGAFAGSADISDVIVLVSRATTISRPGLGVGSRRLIVTISCPSHTGGCRIASRIAISLPGVQPRITLMGPSARIRGGRSGQFAFVLRGKAQAELGSYLLRHRHAHLDVTVYLAIRYGDGSVGRQSFSYTVRGARELALL